MTLTDVYCLFNRARGTELISPDDLFVSVSSPKSPLLLLKCLTSLSVVWCAECVHALPAVRTAYEDAQI
jgi:hypothetical protein